jgi:hypothetical protein
MQVYHYGYQTDCTLSYQFWSDCQQYCADDAAQQLQRSLPTTIIHGQEDVVIPPQTSRDYKRDRPWVQLIEVASDHSLSNAVSKIWQVIQTVSALPPRPASLTTMPPA